MAIPDHVTEALLEWATETQAKHIRAVIDYGGVRAAGRACGVSYSSIQDSIKKVRKKASAKGGYSPAHGLAYPVAPGFVPVGHSIYRPQTETTPAQWIKTRVDDELREKLIREFVESLIDDCRGLAPIIPAPDHAMADLLCVYPLGDPHFGMRSWAEETGEDFNLGEARRVTLAAVDRLVDAAPPAETAILIPLGDIFHADDQSNTTPKSKHQLDVDGRYSKVIRVGVHTFRHAALRLLQRHRRVVIRFVGGNHDPTAVWALAIAIDAFFDAEPRVTVDLSPAAHWYYRFGAVLLGATHGDKSKHAQLLGCMAVDRSKDWGETKHRYFLTGHIHSQTVTELPGLTCESFRTLAARDAYAAGYGYRAGRDMRCIVYHRDHGEVERHRCDIGMVGAVDKHLNGGRDPLSHPEK